MIKKINRLKNFGIFHDFSWQTGLEEFKRFNLIYGWNYSGKTTLSRAFSAIERKSTYDEEQFKQYPQDGEFEITLADRSVVKNDNIEICGLSVKVFNSDYVSDNLKWEEGIEPVFLLGKENIKLQSDLKAKQDLLSNKRQEYLQKQKEIIDKESNLNTTLSDYARNIKNYLSIVNYFKPTLEEDIKLIKDVKQNILSEQDLDNYIKQYQASEKLEKIEKRINLEPCDFANYEQKIHNLLAKTVKGKVIQKLKDNQVLSDWVKQGKDIHQNKTVCEFCGNTLPKDLLKTLDAHYSTEYKELINDIESLQEELKSMKTNVECPDEARFYPEYRSKYKQLKSKFEAETISYNKVLDHFIAILNDKKARAFDSIEFSNRGEYNTNILDTIHEINELSNRHNQRTDSFNKLKEDAEDTLRKHYAALFIQENKYHQKITEIADGKKNLQKIHDQNESVELEIESIETQLSDAVKGAEKINEYLRSYFGTAEIKMAVAEDDKFFKLERSGHRADNLSEGEKTAIAFSHFMTILEDRDTTLANTIVFIDDPVSSLDCNHLYHTYSFINSKLKNCKQFFISTHNFELFNLVKEWFRGKNRRIEHANEGKEDCEKKSIPCEFYMVENFTESGKRRARIKTLEDTLRKFKSEYHFLFDQLNKFKQAESPEYKDLYTITNVARRFLEIFTNFKIPTTGDLASKIKALKIDTSKIDETQQGKVYKLIQELSHGFDPTSTIEHKDKSEIQEGIRIMLDMIKYSDQNHFELLEKEVAKQ